MYIDPSSYVPRKSADVTQRLSDAENVLVCLSKRLDNRVEDIENSMLTKYDLDGIKKKISEYDIASVGRFTSEEYPSEIFNDYENNIASGRYSHAEGQYSEAAGDASHAEGNGCKASGDFSHCEGMGTTAGADYSHAEGHVTVADGEKSHAEGEGSIASGFAAHSEGQSSKAVGTVSHAEGNNTAAYGDYSHAEGMGTRAGSEGGTDGAHAHAEGWNTAATGNSAHSEGNSSTASGNYSHAEGQGSSASGLYSHAEGKSTASGEGTHSEGIRTTASGYAAHGEGAYTKAGGGYSHAEGGNTEATGSNSHAEGSGAKAEGYCSHAGGLDTVAKNDCSTVIGKYNEFEKNGAVLSYAFAIGNGTAADRSNAMTVDWDGNLKLSGSIYCGDSRIENTEISDSVTADSANDTAAGTKAVYDFVTDTVNSIDLTPYATKAELHGTIVPSETGKYLGTPQLPYDTVHTSVIRLSDGDVTSYGELSGYVNRRGERCCSLVLGVPVVGGFAKGSLGLHNEGNYSTYIESQDSNETGFIDLVLPDKSGTLALEQEPILKEADGSPIRLEGTKDGNIAVTEWVKNLASFTPDIRQGVTSTVNGDGTITISGTLLNRYSVAAPLSVYIDEHKSDKYTISVSAQTKNFTVSDNANIYLNIVNPNPWIVIKTIAIKYLNDVRVNEVYSKTVDVSEYMGLGYLFVINIWGETNDTFDNDVFSFLLEEGSVAHSYVPYAGYDITSENGDGSKSSSIRVTNDTPAPAYGLRSFDGETNIFNDYNADMSVVYSRTDTGNALLNSAANADGRIAALEAAVSRLCANT